MATWTADAAVGASILLAGLSLSLGVLGVLAWMRLRAGRLGLIAVAFLLLAVEGIGFAKSAYDSRADLAAGGYLPALLALPLLNLVVVLFLYLAVLKR